MVTELEPAGVLQTVPIAAGQQSHSGRRGGAWAYLPSAVLTSDGDKAGATGVLQTVPIAAGLDGLARATVLGVGSNRVLDSLGLQREAWLVGCGDPCYVRLAST